MRVLFILLIIFFNNYINANNIFKLDGLNYNIRNGTDWDQNNCKSIEQIEYELNILSNITNKIRIYSLIDCNQGYKILQITNKLNLKVWLGIWISNDESIFINEKNQLLNLININLINNNNILGLSIGSETLYRNESSIDKIFTYIIDIKNIINSNNLSFPITTADIIDIYLDFPQLINNLDVLLINQFPFWEKIPINNSIEYFLIKYKKLEKLNNLNKTIIIGETGWSSNGYDNRTSLASPINQANYFIEFYKIAKLNNWKYFYFSSFDELWKNKQLNLKDNVESHFGIFYENATIKKEIFDIIMLNNYILLDNNKIIQNNTIINDTLNNNDYIDKDNNSTNKITINLQLIITLLLIFILKIEY